MPALNLPYLLALVLVDGGLDFVAAQSRKRFTGDERIAARMATIDVVHDPAQERGAGRERTESARVTAHLVGGGVVERFVPFVRGFPSHPMSDVDVEAKALDLLGPHLGATGAADVVSTCRRLDEVDDLRPLVRLLAR